MPVGDARERERPRGRLGVLSRLRSQDPQQSRPRSPDTQPSRLRSKDLQPSRLQSQDAQSSRLRSSRDPLSGPSFARLRRVGDIPVVIMLAWAGWLAVPWSFSGLAQARAAAAAAADAEPPQLQAPAESSHEPPQSPASQSSASQSPALQSPASQPPAPRSFARQAYRQGATTAASKQTAAYPRSAASTRAAWGIPAAQSNHVETVRPSHRDDLCGDPSVPVTSRPDPEPSAASARDARNGVDAWGGADVVASERARIAGEVHDAAGHGLAAIAMQAGIALVTLDDDPEQARASLRAIRETSTTALAQLRAALDGIDPPGADLAGLIDGVRAAGLPVDLEPPHLTVPAHLQDTVYRVVRESLTNVLRHAGPTRALVRATGVPGEFVLEVADRGAGRAGPDAEGRGLAGMRARVTESGGRFAAGPRPGGGFQVVARFPRPTA
ncbi:sensor histidine kinase [Nonomuraea antimicrobica]|uniref:sensor histidine kinase n=1 Tax=Nonomuraea antimicrobica TaxID=561173 RepID=UPI0031EB88FB